MMQKRKEFEDDLLAVYDLYQKDKRRRYGWHARYKISIEDFEDCIQDAYIRASKNFKSYNKEKASIRTWFDKILKNCILDLLRSRKRDSDASNNYVSDPTSPHHSKSALRPSDYQIAVAEFWHIANSFLDQFAPAHKATFFSKAFDIPFDVLVDVTGRNVESLGASYRRKRKMFIDALKDPSSPMGEKAAALVELGAEILAIQQELESPAEMRRTADER